MAASQVAKVAGGGCREGLGAVAQCGGCLVPVVGTDGAVSRRLVAGLIRDGDGPVNAANLCGADANAGGRDAAIAVVQDAILLLVGAEEAITAGQVVGEDSSQAANEQRSSA